MLQGMVAWYENRRNEGTPRRRPLIGYAVAVAGNLADWLFRTSTASWFGAESLYLVSLVVVLASAWYGGPGSMLLALILGAIVSFQILHQVFIGSIRHFHPGHLLSLTLYIAASFLIYRFSESYRRTRRLQEDLRRLARRQQSLREEERETVARRIDDDLGQAVAALKFDAAWLERRIGQAEATAPRDDQGTVMGGESDILSRIRSMNERIDDAILTIRRIATDLRPVILDTLGPVAAIEWQVREFQERTGITCNFTTDANRLPLDRDCSTALFRILQEALAMVTRHAGARCVRVHLMSRPRLLELIIEGDQAGTTEKAAAEDSLHRAAMRERAMVFGGDVRIMQPDSGETRIEVTLSCPCAEWHCRRPDMKRSQRI